MTDRSFRALTLGLLATTALASPAFAQAPAPSDATPATPTTQSPAPNTNATDVTSPPEPVKQAQAARGVPDETEINITATMRVYILKTLPISVPAIGTRRLDQLNISNFEQYTKQLPSVSFQTVAPGFTVVYMRCLIHI
jgi:iron complex outermembrane receptor protein